jgi:hypothetical protein
LHARAGINVWRYYNLINRLPRIIWSFWQPWEAISCSVFLLLLFPLFLSSSQSRQQLSDDDDNDEKEEEEEDAEEDWMENNVQSKQEFNEWKMNDGTIKKRIGKQKEAFSSILGIQTHTPRCPAEDLHVCSTATKVFVADFSPQIFSFLSFFCDLC